MAYRNFKLADLQQKLGLTITQSIDAVVSTK